MNHPESTPEGALAGAAPPTDLELMLWSDGELPHDRASEVAAFVAHDARARAVVASLRMAGDLLSEHALLVAHAAGADAVAENVVDISELEASRRLISSKPAKRARPFTWRAPAVTAFGLAFAAAAAWFVFFRTIDATHLGAPLAVENRSGSNILEPIDPATASIEVVDFGSRPGTIFYVPSEGESVAVVWLSDDDSSPVSGDELP